MNAKRNGENFFLLPAAVTHLIERYNDAHFIKLSWKAHFHCLINWGVRISINTMDQNLSDDLHFMKLSLSVQLIYPSADCLKI